MGGPQWTEEDRAKVVSYLAWASGSCPRCGSRDEDWLDPVTKRTLSEPRLVAEVHRCIGCEELADVHSRLGDDRGLSAFLRRRLPGEADPHIPKYEPVVDPYAGMSL